MLSRLSIGRDMQKLLIAALVSFIAMSDSYRPACSELSWIGVRCPRPYLTDHDLQVFVAHYLDVFFRSGGGRILGRDQPLKE